MAGELHRKLTTILAADVAGYSRLIDDDEEATLSAMRTHRHELIDPLMAAHAGRLANTAGDSLLIEFPSTVEAVRFAIAMQAGMRERNGDIVEDRRIRFRIGINLGDVVAEGDDLVGDGVNVAARLEGQADPDGILISRAVRDQVRDRMALDLEDLGGISVKNIARPVRAFRVRGYGQPGEGALGQVRRRGRWRVAAAVGLLAALIAGAAWWSLRAPEFEPLDKTRLAYALPVKPSIAVLPFQNISGSEDQDVLARGFAEDVLTSLARLSGLFVISGSSTSKFTDASSVKRVAEKLGVRYVLTGSIQHAGDTVRISAQLADAVDGRFVWSGRYDRPFADLFALRDAVTLEIVANVGARLELGERDRVRSRETNSLEAWLLQREGYRVLQKFTAADNAAGRGLLERAIALDPTFATAYSNLALSYRLEYQFGWVPDRAAANREAFRLYNKALEIDPTHGPATASLASWHLTKGDVETATRIAARAATFEPSDYFVHAIYGWTLIHTGDADHAVEELSLSLRLSPHGPDWVLFKLAEAHLVGGDPQAAIDAADRLMARPPSSPSNANLTLIIRALAHDTLGDETRARADVAEAVQRFPRRTVAAWTRQRPYADGALQTRWASRLSLLGMP